MRLSFLSNFDGRMCCLDRPVIKWGMSDGGPLVNGQFGGSSFAWQRFTLLHAIMLIAGLAIGMTLAPWFHSQGPPPVTRQAVSERVVLGFLIGSVTGAPLLFGAQYLIQGRRSGLSLGELIWLSPIFGYSIIIPLSHKVPTPAWLLLLLLLHSGNLAGSAKVLLGGFFFWRPRVPCFWTDLFGALVACLVALYFYADLIIFL
jgi:hypothetical protein